MNPAVIIAVVVAVGVIVFVLTRKSDKPADTSNDPSEYPTVIETPADTANTAAPADHAAEEAAAKAAEEAAAAAKAAEEAAAAQASEEAAEEPAAEGPAAPAAAPVAAAPAGGNAVLLILDVEGEALSTPNRATMNAAKQIADARGAALHICCIGADSAAAAQAGLDGATVHTITDASLGDGVSESYTAAALAALAAVPADVVVGSSSTVGRGMLPRVAEALGCGMITDILSVESADTFTRALWAGSAIATVQGSGRLVISVRATGFDPVETSAAEPQAIAFSAPATKTRFVGRQVTESARPDLSEAAVVVSGGRGTKGNFEIIEALADALGAGMGASRAACDAGWVPNDLQVGQTGKVVAPSLYIAAGISGAIQHIAGMKASKTIVAINKDEDAPIFQVADYGLVADLFDVCPELTEKITAQGLKPTA